jgi:hypothetical protein
LVHVRVVGVDSNLPKRFGEPYLLKRFGKFFQFIFLVWCHPNRYFGASETYFWCSKAFVTHDKLFVAGKLIYVKIQIWLSETFREKDHVAYRNVSVRIWDHPPHQLDPWDHLPHHTPNETSADLNGNQRNSTIVPNAVRMVDEGK